MPWSAPSVGGLRLDGRGVDGVVFAQTDREYLIEGRVVCAGGPAGGNLGVAVRDARGVVNSSRFALDALEDGHFAFRFSTPLSRVPGVIFHAQAPGQGEVRLQSLNVWGVAREQAGVSPAALAKRLRRADSFPYRLLERAAEADLYECPEARPLACFVRETRPAPDPIAAAVAQRESKDRPVTELAFVSPAGSGGVEMAVPREFSEGRCEVTDYRPGDIRLRTSASGEGFLVLTVTRCRGWAAEIDGRAVPIESVDGPLMGIV